MDAGDQYSTEKPCRQARKGWIKFLWIGLGLGVMGLIAPFFLTKFGELNKITFERIRFKLEQTPLEGVRSGDLASPNFLRKLQQRCIERDPWFKEIGFEDRLDQGKLRVEESEGSGEFLKDISAWEFLMVATMLNQGEVEIFDGTIYLLPQGDTARPLVEAVIEDLPVGFFTISGSATDEWIDVKEEIIEKVVKFPKGSSAFYNPKENKLKLVTSQTQIDSIDPKKAQKPGFFYLY